VAKEMLRETTRHHGSNKKMLLRKNNKTPERATGCSKDQNTDCAPVSERVSKNVPDIANANNPYDYCGRIHNEMLDYIINNNPHPTHEDIFILTQKYLQEQYDISCDITFEDINNSYTATTDFIIDAFLGNASFNEIIEVDVIAGALDVLVDYSKSIMISNALPSPQEYADYLIEHENQVVKSREDAGISPDEVSEYDVALGTFAIARYSYSYWYEVAHNPDNAWNNVKKEFKRQDGDDPKPGFWKRLWGGIRDVAETVVKAVATPVVDATGFAYGAITNNGPVSPNSHWVGFTGSKWLNAGLQTAGDWSGRIWD